jgi:hypothetical protein
MRANYINEKLTGFTEDSDAIRDMGIGLKPDEVLENFASDFHKAFNLLIYFDQCGTDYDVEYDQIYRVGEESFDTRQDNPVVKLLVGQKHELDFALSNKAANGIVKGAPWGWFYWTNGKVVHLKDAYTMDQVFRAIIKINGIELKGFDNAIKRYESYIKAIKKMKQFASES